MSQVINFAQLDFGPIMALCLALLVVLMLRNSRLRQKLTKRMQSRFGSAPQKPTWRSLKNFLYLFGMLCLAFALLRPQWGDVEHSTRVEGLDICLAVDLSNSMLAEDITPNRLEQVKNQVSLFLPRLLGDRAAVVPFAVASYVAAPLSTDYSGLISFLQVLEPGFISQQGTNFEAALKSCHKALGLDGLNVEDAALLGSAKVILMISDGDDNLGDPSQILQIQRQLGVGLFGMAVGTEAGAPIPRRDDQGRLRGHHMSAGGGEQIIAKLQSSRLENIVKESGGQVFFAAEGISAWQRFETSLSRFKRDMQEGGKTRQKEERFQIFLALAFLLLFFDFLLPEMGWRRSGAKFGSALLLITSLNALSPTTALANSVIEQGLAARKNAAALKAFDSEDYSLSAELMREAIAENATDYRLRKNWATSRLFAATEGVTAEGSRQVNSRLLSEAKKEYQALLNEHSQDSEQKELIAELQYQLGQIAEIEEEPQEALKHYYASLRSENVELRLKASTNISRLLTQEESSQDQNADGEGEGEGDSGENGDGESDGEGDSRPPPGSAASQERREPEFSGTDVDAQRAQQILDSVASQERGVLKKNAREEAKRQAIEQGQDLGELQGHSEPW